MNAEDDNSEDDKAKPAPVKKVPPPIPAPTPTTAGPANQCPSSTPVIERNDLVSAGGSQPEREIHYPSKDNVNAEQLRFCSKLLDDIHRNTHWEIASPFYEPFGASASILGTTGWFLTIALCRLGFPRRSILP